MQRVLQPGSRVALVPSPIPTWTDEALIVVRQGDSTDVVRIDYKADDPKSVRMVKGMFDMGDGIKPVNLDSSSSDYAALRSVALVLATLRSPDHGEYRLRLAVFGPEEPEAVDAKE